MNRHGTVWRGRRQGVRGGAWLLCAAGTLLVAGLSSCEKPKTPAARPKSQLASRPASRTQPALSTQWLDLFDGKTLTGWKVPKWGGDGKVYVKDGVVHMQEGEMCTGITYTGKMPREDFEVAMEGMRVGGSDFFCALTFPVGKGEVSLVLGGWGGGVVGISCIDGFDASENDTTAYVEFKDKRWYRVRVRVTKQWFKAFLDDKQIVHVDRQSHKFEVRAEVDQSRPLGIATWQTHGAARNIRLRLLKAAEKDNGD